MKSFHSLHASVFIKKTKEATEDADSLKKAFLSLFPFDLEEEKLKLSEEKSTGITGNTITILKLTLTKERLIKATFQHLLSHLSTKDKTLLATQENRVDEQCQFFIRLDKAQALKGNYVLTDSGNCIHLRFSVAAFPKKRESALLVIKNVFSKGLY